MSAAGVFALMGALQGAALAVVLWKRRRQLPANRWLALLMALVSVRLVNQLAFRSSLFGTSGLSPRLTLPLLFAFAPLLFLYLDALVRPPGAGRQRYAAHFLPALAVLAYTVPFYWTAARTPVHTWTAYGQSLRWESTIFNGLIVAQIAFYLVRIRRLLPRYDRRVSEVASDVDAARVRWIHWLAWALAAEAVVLGAVVLLHVLGIGAPIVAQRDVLMAAFVAATIYGTGYMALSQSALFGEETQGEPGPKYVKSSLSPDRALEGARLIRSLMETDRMYADFDLSLATLASRVGLPPAHVSQIVNERMGQSFYDMVNGYRVEEAKKRLLDPRTRQQKVLAVGLEVGFRSKAAFNRVFKLKTGLTPSEFRAEAEAEASAAASASRTSPPGTSLRMR